MEEFLDVSYIEKRKQHLEKKYTSIEEGVYIDCQILNFQKEVILDEFSIPIPMNFGEMPEALSKVKYPSKSRPQYILTNEGLTVDFGFSVYEKEGTSLNKYIKIKELIGALTVNPAVSKMSDVKPLKNEAGYYFKFHQKVIDGDLFHMIANISFDEVVVQCAFNCLLTTGDLWEKVVLQVWESIERKVGGVDE